MEEISLISLNTKQGQWRVQLQEHVASFIRTDVDEVIHVPRSERAASLEIVSVGGLPVVLTVRLPGRKRLVFKLEPEHRQKVEQSQIPFSGQWPRWRLNINPRWPSGA